MIKLAITITKDTKQLVHKMREDETFEEAGDGMFKRTFASWDEAIAWGLQQNDSLIISRVMCGPNGYDEDCSDCDAELEIYNGYRE